MLDLLGDVLARHAVPVKDLVGEQQPARLVDEAHAGHDVVPSEQQGLCTRRRFGGMGEVVDEDAILVMTREAAGVRSAAVEPLVESIKDGDARRGEGGGGGDDTDHNQLLPGQNALQRRRYPLLQSITPC